MNLDEDNNQLSLRQQANSEDIEESAQHIAWPSAVQKVKSSNNIRELTSDEAENITTVQPRSEDCSDQEGTRNRQRKHHGHRVHYHQTHEVEASGEINFISDAEHVQTRGRPR